ncbi:F0F1 ATP synthase subunit gamma [Hwanghaeella grinnelliae]|nr:F0F1 ATP synthase subunit gamma [Hwanghaeella grinnelliae]
MEQLAHLKERIASLQDLGGLIRALRALSASHVQEAQSALTGIRNYVETIEDAVVQGVDLLPGPKPPAPSGGEPTAAVLIAVCSEHGFVGALNERLLDEAAGRRGYAGLAVIGRRGAMLAEERHLDLAWTFPMATDVPGVLRAARHAAQSLAHVTQATILYATYRPGGNYEIVAKDILPLAPDLLARTGRKSPPLHHLRPAQLLERLADEYLFAEITHAIMQSLASENGARLRVMESADRNIDKKLHGLRRDEHAQRQEAITAELLDVVVGVEAITGRP